MKKILSVLFILGLTLMVTLGNTGCGKKGGNNGKNPVSAADTPVDIFKFIPDGTTLVFHLNLEKSKTIPLCKELADSLRNNGPGGPVPVILSFEDMFKDAGIDIGKSVREVLFTIKGDLTAGFPAIKFLAIFRMTGNRQTLENHIKTSMSTVTDSYAGYVLYKGSAGNVKLAATFTDDGTLVTGHETSVREALDTFKSKTPGMMENPQTQKYLTRIHRERVASLLLAIPDQLKQVRTDETFSFDLSRAEFFIISSDYETEKWKLDVELITHSPETNDQMVSMLDSLKAVVADADPAGRELVKKFHLSATDESVRLKAILTDKLLKDIAQRIKAFNELTKSENQPQLKPVPPKTETKPTKMK